jgi:hypothetical protein
MAMKMNAKVVGYGPDPGRAQALVNVIVEFSGPSESMTLTVIVPNEGYEASLQEQGIARAKTFALPYLLGSRAMRRPVPSITGARLAPCMGYRSF